MRSSTCRVLRFVGPEQVEIDSKPVPTPSDDEVRVRTTLSAVSPGTEKLVYRGEAPAAHGADPNISSLSGGLEYPLKYGYAAVGRVDGVGVNVPNDWEGRRVFSFQPHASHFVTTPNHLIPLPADVTDADGVMVPSVETAVNLSMDGAPSIGDRVVLFGQGTIGLLTTDLMSRHPVSGIYTVDPDPACRTRSLQMGADNSFSPDEIGALRTLLNIEHHDARPAEEGRYEGADVVYELSGQPDVLDQALTVAGFAGTVVVGSWYGTKQSCLDLGTRFHRSRVSIESSQVSTINPKYRGRWTKERRMNYVLDLLPDLEPSSLISETHSISNAKRVYSQLNQDQEGLEQPVFQYD